MRKSNENLFDEIDLVEVEVDEYSQWMMNSV
jgi:hypothetical protein